MARIFKSMIVKESLHIVRDRRTMLITLLMPLVLLLLFGFAISTEVNNVRVVTVVDRHDAYTRDIVQRLSVNDYFSFEGTAAMQDVEGILRRGDADAAIVLRDDNGQHESQIIVDASNTAIAKQITVYLSAVIGGNGTSPVIVHTLYNPQMKSAYNFVPGIMGMIFILICAIMTSVSIVSEKESGTMDLLLVSPVKSRTIIFGKLVPYFLLSCIILAVMLLMAYTVLGLPISGTVAWVVAVSLLYIVLSLSLGLLVSTLARTQVSALIVSAVLFMLPVLLLSGMIFPIENMPAVLQLLSCIIPAKWYIDAMRTLMIQQANLSYVLDDVAILFAMTAAILFVSIKKFTHNEEN